MVDAGKRISRPVSAFRLREWADHSRRLAEGHREALRAEKRRAEIKRQLGIA